MSPYMLFVVLTGFASSLQNLDDLFTNCDMFSARTSTHNTRLTALPTPQAILLDRLNQGVHEGQEVVEQHHELECPRGVDHPVVMLDAVQDGRRHRRRRLAGPGQRRAFAAGGAKKPGAGGNRVNQEQLARVLHLPAVGVGKTMHGSLGGGVSGVAGDGQVGHGRGGDDHLVRAVMGQGLHLLQDVERGQGVDAVNTFEMRPIWLRQFLEIGEAGVGDEEVYAAELGERRLEKLIDRFGLPHVGEIGCDLSGALPVGRGCQAACSAARSLQGRGVEVHRQDLHAALGQAAQEGQPNAGGGAGQDDARPVQIHRARPQGFLERAGFLAAGGSGGAAGARGAGGGGSEGAA